MVRAMLKRTLVASPSPSRCSPIQTVPAGSPPWGSGPARAGCGEAHRGAQHPAGPLCHCERHLVADRVVVARSEQAGLDGTVVGHDRATQHVAAAGHIGEARRYQPAGHGLGEAECQPLRPQHRQHHRLHGVVVGAEHGVADHGPSPGLHACQHPQRGLVVGGFGGDADLQALHAAGEEGDGGLAAGVEAAHLRLEHLGQARLGMAPGAQGAAADHVLGAGSGAQVAEHALVDHLLHLPGNARHGVEHLLVSGAAIAPADRADQAGRGAGLYVHHPGALRHVGLAQVVGGHGAVAAVEHRPDPLHHRLVAVQLDAHHRGDRVAGDVIGGGPEPAAHDHRVAALQRLLEGCGHALQVVADLGLEVAVYPGERQLLTDPRRVRVDDLAEQ